MTTASTITSAAVLALLASVASAQDVSLRLGHIFSATHPIGLGAEALADYVEAESDGRMEIVIFPNAQLGGLRALEDAASDGLLDIAQSAAPTLQAIYPTATVLTLPYAFRDADHLAEVWAGSIGENMRKGMVDEVGLRVLSALPQPPRHISANAPIHGVEDMAGLRIRVPQVPSWVAFFEELGAIPTPIDLGELVTSLQLGVVTAEENPYATMESMKLSDVQDYLVPTGHVRTLDFFLVSEQTYEALPEDLQQILMDGGSHAEEVTAKAWDETSALAIDALQAAGMEMVEVDNDAIAAATADLYLNFLQPGDQAIYENIQALR